MKILWAIISAVCAGLVPLYCYGQGVKTDAQMKIEITALVDKAKERGMMTVGMRDSINMFLLSDSLTIGGQTEKLKNLRYFLEKNLVDVPQTLPAPMTPGSKGGSIDKGVGGFYKNDRGMKYEGRGWYDPKVNEMAAKRAMSDAARNVALNYKCPAFLKNMLSSDSNFIRLLGNLLLGFDNGARAQAAPTNSLTRYPVPGDSGSQDQ